MKEQIIQWCKQLSGAQGYYGRLLDKLEHDEAALNKLAEMNFKDIIDFVLYIEG